MLKVGLSPRLKDRSEKFDSSLKPFEAQSFKQKRGTHHTISDNSGPLSSIMLSPTLTISKDDIVFRNRNGGLPGVHQTEVVAHQPPPEHHLKLLHRLQEDKQNRKKREEQRR